MSHDADVKLTREEHEEIEMRLLTIKHHAKSIRAGDSHIEGVGFMMERSVLIRLTTEIEDHATKALAKLRPYQRED